MEIAVYDVTNPLVECLGVFSETKKSLEDADKIIESESLLGKRLWKVFINKEIKDK